VSAKGKAWGLATAACVGIWLVQTGLHPVTPPAPSASEASAGLRGHARAEPGAPTGRGSASGRGARPLAPSAPVRLRIPRIGVDAPMTGLGLAADGSLDAPPAKDGNLAGWYRNGTAPGAKGTAIVAGHVDTARGPAVFYSLGTLRKGDGIEVARRDGSTALFTVDAVELYKNSAFPDRKVYATADRAELRVITCGGGFSRRTGYEGNVVTYAHLAGARP
jgi:hypothetical protein